ncbi:hypothetical protein [Neolewinella antarctica]|uniref:Glucan phosphoethanolaminetransferase (Alkaline phosphatase superfamily) n=1 Tax=Neolewinella antarctica TaxID=442734 RepID=A0ABX0XH72_9BACT|nr:hypothetical protein [Neolewinella antarctica]NJC28097.1 glucan phosphoethanolaminetransferase (alkaline phosphatase superfamily) [Neolewinella antarctica]
MTANKRGTQAGFELLWLAFTLVVAALILLPLYTKVPDFPFFLPNFIYVVVAVTFTRYMFLLDLSWLRDRLYLQAGISLAVIPLIFWMVQSFNGFITYFDEQGPDVLVRNLSSDWRSIMDKYMHAEYRFFGVWAIMASAVLPFRLLYNTWVRYRAGVR